MSVVKAKETNRFDEPRHNLPITHRKTPTGALNSQFCNLADLLCISDFVEDNSSSDIFIPIRAVLQQTRPDDKHVSVLLSILALKRAGGNDALNQLAIKEFDRVQLAESNLICDLHTAEERFRIAFQYSPNAAHAE